MSQVITKQFDVNIKAIFTMNFKIASTTAETYTIVPSDLNNSKGWATGATANSGDVCTNLTINKVWWSVNNSAVTKPLLVEWKATSNSQAITCNYADSKDFSAIGGLLNPLTPGTGGATGGLDIKFLSVTDDDTATLVLELLKIYTVY